MKLRIYLDTSVLSALVDDRTPERMQETREFWLRRKEYEVSTSAMVRAEIEQASDAERKRSMLAYLSETAELSVSQEARDTAEAYVERGLFSPAMYNDAFHLAVAVLARQDILVSWNFHHLVNRRKRAQVCDTNALMGLPMIEILAPTEL